MYKIYFSLFISFLVSFYCPAQELDGKTLANSFATHVTDYPGLGMKVISKESDKHVLISKNGRYIVKGTLQDLWEGVESPFVYSGFFSSIPERVKEVSNYILIGDGSKPSLDVFISYSCKTCEAYIKDLLSDKFLNKYSAHVYLVYINDLDKSIVTDIYCSDDKYEAFIKRFVERDLSNISGDCSVLEPKMNVAIASSIPIRSLPASIFPNVKKIFYGLLDTSLLTK